MNCLKALRGDCCKACDLKLRLRKQILDCKSRLKGQPGAAWAADCSSISESKGYCCGTGDSPQAYPLTKKNLTDLPLGTNVKSSTWNPNTCFTETSPDCILFKNCSSPQHHFSLWHLMISTSAQFSKEHVLFCSGLYSMPTLVISQHLPAAWQPTSLTCLCHMLMSLLLRGRNLYRWK